MKGTKVTFETGKLNYSSELMRALAHPLRLKILEFIDDNKSINVNKIYSNLDLEQSITSQHLKILRMSGVVSVEVTGKYHVYQINYDVIERVSNAISNFKEFDKHDYSDRVFKKQQDS
jgi:ArsR family transcriptional regulator